MASPKPGEIRCPTCHRSTPPAAFCTQCGTAIPADARVRPRGMDRSELEERIRYRRSGGEPFRRGAPVEDEWRGGYEAYEPEPEDVAAQQAAAAAAAGHVDHLAESAEPWAEPETPSYGDITRPLDDELDTWREPEVEREAAVVPPPPSELPPDPGFEQEPEPREPVVPVWSSPEAPAEPTHVDHFDDERYADDEYAYDEEYEPERWVPDARSRRAAGGGGGGFAILAILGLGAVALLGGALLGGFLDGDGAATLPSPTPVVTDAPSETEPPLETEPPAETPPEETEPEPGDEPVAFPDGFVGELEPCDGAQMDFDGCAVNGASLSGGAVFVWIGFTDASASDALTLSLNVGEQTIAQQEVVIGQALNCPTTCTGYLNRGFQGLTPGDYMLELTRNGEFAHRAPFRVEG